jgi:hypothetical protein
MKGALREHRTGLLAVDATVALVVAHIRQNGVDPVAPSGAPGKR